MARRILVPLALLVAAVLAAGVWWSARRPHATESTSLAAAVNAPPKEPERTALDAPEREEERRVSSPVPVVAPAAERVPGRGSISGRVRAGAGERVSGGWARITLPPPPPGTVRDAEEDLQLYIAEPFALIDREGGFVLPRVPLGEWNLSIMPVGFERRSTRITVDRESPATEVELVTVRALPAPLAIELQDTLGFGVTSERCAIDPDARASLRAVILETCPAVGAELPERPNEMKYVQDRERAPGAWASIVFEEPMEGCACVVLGRRVLDVAPFAAGQPGVVLRIGAETLQKERRSMRIVVRDDARFEPLASATVKFEPEGGRQRVRQTDANGVADVDDLLARNVTVVVELAGYVSQRVKVELGGSTSDSTRTITLGRAFVIRGRTQFQVQPTQPFLIAALRIEPTEGKRVLTSEEFVSRGGEFTLDGLRPGEYIVGLATLDEAPDPARVRRGEVAGWVLVDLRRGDVSGVVLDVPINALQGGFRADADLIHELMKERGGDR